MFPIVGLASFMLMIAIGFLLIAQVLMIAANLTTLESFLEGIEDHVFFLLFRTPSTEEA